MPSSRTRPSVPSFERAVRLHLSGELDRAAREYRRCVAADPRFAEAMNNLATILASRGDHGDALVLLRRAVEVQPAYAEAHHNIGLTCAAQGRSTEAVGPFERALAIEPERPRWWDDLANARVECFRFADALIAFDRALSLEPLNADVWNNRGLALRGLRRADDAVASFRRALSIEPGHTNALSNLGTVLKEERRFEDAIAAFEEALARRPNDASLLVNFAAVFEMMGDYERLRDLAERAQAADPLHAEPHVLLGNYWMEQGRYDDAERMHLEAVRLDPENRNANWNLAILWLLRGDFARGWTQYEWRKRLQSTLIEHVEYPVPEWDGAPLAGRTILLHAEQGIGDAIQFVRFAPLCKAAGAARVIVEAPYPILPILAGAPGVDATVARGAPLPAFDVHVPMLSLPYLLGMTPASLPAAPYLAAGERPAAALVDAPAGVLRVGIVWAGNPIHRRDHLRSIAIDALAPLFDVPGTQFYSLQKGAPSAQLEAHRARVIDLGPALEDFRDTAAVMQRLDLVITVDTSVAHLAGAMGLPVWTLITHVPDFRWMLERSDSPWYPTMRLFRQPAPRDWATVVSEVRTALAARVAAGVPSRANAAAPVAMTTLRCATARPDSLPRFELTLPLADLADPAMFTAYEAELVGGGHERAVRDFLDEALGAADLLIDVAPGLGLTALASAGAAAAPRVVAIEHDAAAATRLRAGAAANQLAGRFTVVAADDETPALIAAARRCAIRVGEPAATARASRLLHDAGALDRPIALLWPAVAPQAIAAVLDGFSGRGWQVLTVSTGPDGVALDPFTEPAAVQALVALSPAMLAALTGAAPASVSTTPNALVTPANGGVTHAGLAMKMIGFDWEVRSDSGWGVYGLNLATRLAQRTDVAPVVFAAVPDTLPADVRQSLAEPLARQQGIAAALASPATTLDLAGLMLRALGNNMAHGPLWTRIRARHNAGVIFFEDAAFDTEALGRARQLDMLIAGSSWNGEVLRSLGLAPVHVVLQGIDPTLFHPGPRAGTFDDRFVVFSGGKLEYRKGQDIVVAAFRRFAERHPDALLVTAWHNHWASMITDLDLAGHTQGVPRFENGIMHTAEWLLANGVAEGATIDIGCTPNAAMPSVLREADVALFPNRCEGGTNLVAMEAMACGVPTIVSANSGHLDLVATGGCFALTRQGPVRAPSRFFRSVNSWGESDVEEIVSLLDRLYDDRSLARATADIGARAMSSLSWPKQIDSLVDTLRPLL